MVIYLEKIVIYLLKMVIYSEFSYQKWWFTY